LPGRGGLGQVKGERKVSNTHLKLDKNKDLSRDFYRAINLIQEGRRLLKGVTITASVHLLENIGTEQEPIKDLENPACYDSIKEAFGAESNEEAMAFVLELLSADGQVNANSVGLALDQIEDKTR
jgi:hypothetical protein